VALIDRRIGLLFLAFVVLLGVAGARATYLGVIKAGSLQQDAVTQQMTLVKVPAQRGSITDRNGLELAISETADDVAADPLLIKDPQGAAQQLAPLLGKPVATVAGALSKRRGFVYLAHLLPGNRAAAVTALARKLKIDGISLIPQVKRVYPRSWAASQVLGAVGWDDQGLSGLEYRYNAALRGTNGERSFVNSAIGQPISIHDVRTTQPGKAIKLTIDAAVQDEVEQILAGVGAQYQPKGATAIAMDPNTGAILALANWPRINANDIAGAPSYANENRAVGFTYEPGSTFKAITVSGALQDGAVTPDTQIAVPSVLQVADRKIHDAEVHGDETLSVAQIIQRSSNIGAVQIGMREGAQRFDYWVHRFGFGSLSGIDLPGDERGIIKTYQQYSGSSMGNLPIGQGESVTAIQMAAAYAAIANGGILRSPHVVDAIGAKARSIPRGIRIISPSVAAQMRAMLRGVFADGGTASGAAIPGYDLAGKTGTANDVVNGSYSATEYTASFIGFVPASAPRLLVAIMVDRPKGAIYGGAVAAPAFRKIVGWAVPYLGISPR
jgi:cell division protein FtsI (penicillin-binding protein 3)